MKRTRLVLASSLFLVFAFAISACAQSAPATSSSSQPTTTKPTTTAAATPVATTIPPSAEAPKYGGEIVIGSAYNIIDFDGVYGFEGNPGPLPMHLTNEELWIGDWTLGPAGKGITFWAADRPQFKTGAVAESWDFSQAAQGTLIFKLRHGIRYAQNPNSEAAKLVGGRELVADDVVYSIMEQATNPRSFLYGDAPYLRNGQITAPDKYTLSVKVDPQSVVATITRVTDFLRVVPPEVSKKYGDMRDWHNNVGSGPFILTDFVDSSSLSFVKNANYWMKDPIGPGQGNQLPYADSVKVLMIPEQSTREAAMRAGKIDVISGLTFEAGPAMMKQVPQLRYRKAGKNGSPGVTSMRVDKAPFSDIRVRRALMMALDFNAINKNLFGDDARTLTWPVGYYDEYKDAYLGLDDPAMPASVKELYSYSPDKAKQLLADAGFPNGFKASMVIRQDATIIDYYSMLQAMWAKIGVNINLDIKEYAVYMSMLRGRAYDQMEYGTYSPIANLYSCTAYQGDTQTNSSYVPPDPTVEKAKAQMQALAVTSPAEADKIHKELMKYVLDQAWAIPYPAPANYVLWWPWLKNYYGITSVGYIDEPNWTLFAWVDQSLKKSISGK